MTLNPLGRRTFLGGTALSLMALTRPVSAATTAPSSESFSYEITRSDAEWRAMLSKPEYVVLRKGSTELPKSNPLWNHFEPGSYHCRGCDLTVYDSIWKVPVDKGWAFFSQSRENAILMGIDGPVPDGMSDDGPGAMIEAHCRRCGSHLGHILTVEGTTLHCINGISLTFQPATT